VPTAAAAAVVSSRSWDDESHPDHDHEGTTVITGHTGGLLPPTRPSRPGPDDGSADEQAPTRSRRGPLLLALVLLLATVAGVAGWYYGMGRYTTTPGVINLSVEQARTKVEAAGLGFKVGDREYSETVTAGSVISTDPSPGTRILEDGTVEVTVSRGPERYEVPVLRGMTLEEATAELERSNLAVGGVTERFHDSVAEGVVLRSDPTTGTEVKPDAAVDLVVSKGPRPIEVPDFTGKSAARAEQVLTELGLEVEVTRENSDTVPEGDVISQNPSSGTLFRGDTVQLVASKGPLMVEVPAVQGVGVVEATQRLEAAGFQVQTTRSDVYVGLEFVVKSDPPQGTLAPQGSIVTLYLV
jgi:beta-lactam-binding protein with PASTA domain